MLTNLFNTLSAIVITLGTHSTISRATTAEFSVVRIVLRIILLLTQIGFVTRIQQLLAH